MKYNRIFNIFVLIFGVLCILYWLGMGLAVRFGQSLLWLWPVVGALCIARYALVRRAAKMGRPLPFPPRLIKTARILLCVFLAVFAAGEALICTGAHAQSEAGLDCVIVLGAKVNGTKPSGRADAADMGGGGLPRRKSVHGLHRLRRAGQRRGNKRGGVHPARSYRARHRGGQDNT